MNNKPYKVKVSVSLDEDVIEKCKCLAEDDDRSFSQYINLVLRKWLKEIESNRECDKKSQTLLKEEDTDFPHTKKQLEMVCSKF